MQLLLLLIGVVQVFEAEAAFDFSDCNKSHSCWFQPPGCSSEGENQCKSGVMWAVEPDGLQIQIEAQTADLDPSRPIYAAVGFSFNQRMDDDTVVECVHHRTGDGVVRISFNDETFNSVLPQASSVLLKDQVSTLDDGILSCTAKLLFDNRDLVSNETRFMIHNLEDGSYYLLFARGSADFYTLEKDIHNMNDGELFPWMSGEKVSFCRDNCTSSNIVRIDDALQSPVPRWWRYRIAVLHGVALITAWWVIGSSAMIIARYFKPLFPRRKLLGTAVWFQLHRDLMILSVVLQILAVFFIFYQSNWIWFQCSYQCSEKDWNKKMHAITGFGATCLALIQPVIAFSRPAPSSSVRPIFNWVHWLLGMTAWTLASVTMVLAIPMGKTGLLATYGHVPNWIMGGYIAFFLFCNVLLEMICSSSPSKSEKVSDIQPHRFSISASGMALANLNGPSNETALTGPKRESARLLIFFIHLFVSLAVAICITTMLVKILLSHSP